VITEGISNNQIQLVRREEAESKDSSRFNKASPSEAVDNLKTNLGEPDSPGFLDSNDIVNPSQKPDADSEAAGLSSETQEDTESVVEEMVREMNQKFDRSGLHLKFGTDQESGLEYFQLIDKQNGNVIKQYPPEERLEMVARMRDMAGVIFNEKV